MRKDFAKLVLFSLCLSVCFSLLAAGAHASVQITSAYADTYKIGDMIPLDGYFEAENNGLGNIRIDLRCAESKTPFTIYWKSVEAKKGQQILFSELGISSFKSIATYKGDCQIEATTSFGDNAKSNVFMISSALIGTFTIDKESVKLGEPVVIVGDIKDISGNPVSENALFFLRGENLNMLIGEQSIVDGKLEMHYTPLQVESGNYAIIAIFDGRNTDNELDTGVRIEIKALIDAEIILNKESYKPGDTFTVNVKPSDNAEAKARFLFYKEDEMKEQKDGLIAYTTTVPADARVGKTAMNVILYDKYGNMAYFTRPFTVEQAVAKIDIEHSFSNEDFALKVKAAAYDQTGKKVVTLLELKVAGEANSNILGMPLMSDTEKVVNIPLDIKAGDYKVMVSRDLGSAEGTFTVDRDEKLEFAAVEDGILVTNRGNADYSQPVTVTTTNLKGKTQTFEYQLDVEYGKDTKIPLNEHVRSGIYDAEVSYLEDDQMKSETVGEVSVPNGLSVLSSITGNAVVSSKPLTMFFYVVLFVIIMAGIAIGVYHYFGSHKSESSNSGQESPQSSSRPAAKASSQKADPDTVDLSKYNLIPVKREKKP